MGGRLREVCAGVNVDLGTAAAFREQWAREAEGVATTDAPPRPLLLKTDQAPGDAVAMTAAIYSLHRAHPGKYITAVESYWPEVFAHNPNVPIHLLPSADDTTSHGMEVVRMHYPAVHQSNERGIHFMQAWCEHLGRALGVDVPLLTNRPRLYFDPYDYDDLPVENYWVVCSGGKRDFTNKLWGHHNYEEVVRLLHDRVNFVQVGGSKPPMPWAATTVGSQEDDHPPLSGLYKYMVGMTTLRDLFNLVRRARGVLCGVSLLMHVAAALGKPAVVIAGGREPRQWNQYPRQTFISNVGWLPCRSTQGIVGDACWRARVVPLGDGTMLDNDTCEYPVDGIPKCMRLITPEYVVETIKQVESGYACIKKNSRNG